MRLDLFVQHWLSQQTDEFTATQLADAINKNSVFNGRWTRTRVIRRILEPLMHEGSVTRREVEKVYRTGVYNSRHHTRVSVWSSNNISNRAQETDTSNVRRASSSSHIGNTVVSCVLTPSISISEEAEGE